LPEDTLLAMPGAHNRQNAALAYQALKAVSLTDDEIFAGLASFPGVPGRLQFVGERNEVRIINDNNSTTPQATIAGLKAVGDSEEKNIVLVVGGAYKDIDPTELIETIPLYCKAVILLPGTGSEKLKGLAGVVLVETMEAAVSEAFKAAETGDTVLFSPGFASFGLFKNEYERNDAFIEAIKQA
jgi:UDP-N-acetylmuramoylalanine--D-glutamate ligase